MVHHHGAIVALCLTLAVGAAAHEALVEKSTSAVEVVCEDASIVFADGHPRVWPYKYTNGLVTVKSRYFINWKADNAAAFKKDSENFSTNAIAIRAAVALASP
jgi:hypothetical protein